MAKYRKKPVVIEAFQYTGEKVAMSAVPSWLWNALLDRVVTPPPDEEPEKYLNITTLEGVVRCDLSDWIIRGVKGELYPCKPDIFEATYEPA